MHELEDEHTDDVDTILAMTLRWAPSYGDLMSVLMVLFLLLYSFSSLKTTEGIKSIDSFQKKFGAKHASQISNTIKQINLEEDAAKEIKGFIEDNNLSSYAIIKVDDFQIKIMLTQAVMFSKGDNVLLPASIPVLKKLAQMLNVISNNVVVEGHTDDIPIQGGSNFELSSKRALAVLQYFQEQGIALERVSIAGYGSYRPIVKNDTDENRARNRRVEINIVRKHSDML